MADAQDRLVNGAGGRLVDPVEGRPSTGGISATNQPPIPVKMAKAVSRAAVSASQSRRSRQPRAFFESAKLPAPPSPGLDRRSARRFPRAWAMTLWQRGMGVLGQFLVGGIQLLRALGEQASAAGGARRAARDGRRTRMLMPVGFHPRPLRVGARVSGQAEQAVNDPPGGQSCPADADQTRSMASAMPCPPPMHMVISALDRRFAPARTAP